MNLDFQDAQRGPKKRGSKKTGLQSQFLEFVPRAEAAGRGKEEKTGGKSPARLHTHFSTLTFIIE